MNMLDGFVVFDFNVGSASASITPNGVTFNKSVVIKLGFPKYAQLLINKQLKQIAVRACEKDDEKAYEFYGCSPDEKPVRSVRWNHKDLLNSLSELMDWDLKKVAHRVEGKMLPEENVMLFDLTTAKDL
ncbi:MAG: hypothetical protein II049_07360 [Clostridia bacterium]|nr:hypothetical protein [Clostridia bacterium]